VDVRGGRLGDAPERWSELDAESLTATEQEALRLVTAAGLVERKFSFRLLLIGHPVRIEVTATATGAYGLAEAMEPVLRKAWDLWGKFYREHRDSSVEERPQFFCEKTDPEKWRLADQGVVARQDLGAGNSKVVLDFVQGRTVVFYGRAVPGHGRADRIEEMQQASEPGEVVVANLAEVSEPLKDIATVVGAAFEKMIALHGRRDNPSNTTNGAEGNSSERPSAGEDGAGRTHRTERESVANGATKGKLDEILDILHLICSGALLQVGASGLKPEEMKERFDKLPPSRRKAWMQWFAAQRVLKNGLDREAYEWVREHLEPGERLVSFRTWCRYVRGARRALGLQKRSVKRAAPSGKSVVSANDVEPEYYSRKN